jgi:hypothetical protein
MNLPELLDREFILGVEDPLEMVIPKLGEKRMKQEVLLNW